ncbi:MAG: single-stranded DNA-binding protein [Peptococcaceae bacterium]|nr:single-stranded DNA-binding protein [Peptococcaceae bacterium]
MNKVILIGRLTADPELRYTPNGAAVCSFRIAVDRPFNSQSGERGADFINIVVWNKAAENTAKYMSKGRQIAVEGRLQIRSYDGNDGQRRWVTEVVADRVEFLGGGGNANNGGDSYGGNYGGQNQNYQHQNDQFTQAAPSDHSLGSFGTEVSFSDDDLPF